MHKTRCGGQGRPKGLMPFDSASIKITTLKWMAIVIPTSLRLCNSRWMTSTKDPTVGVAWWQTFLGYNFPSWRSKKKISNTKPKYLTCPQIHNPHFHPIKNIHQMDDKFTKWMITIHTWTKFADMFENPIFDGKDINLLYGWWLNMSGLGRNVYRKKVYTYPMSPFDYRGTLHVSLWKILMKGMHKNFHSRRTPWATRRGMSVHCPYIYIYIYETYS
jgi:hypothetical protein